MHPPSTMRRGLCRPLRLNFFLPLLKTILIPVWQFPAFIRPFAFISSLNLLYISGLKAPVKRDWGRRCWARKKNTHKEIRFAN